MEPVKTSIPEMKNVTKWGLRARMLMIATMILGAAGAVFAYAEFYSTGTVPVWAVFGIGTTISTAVGFTVSQKEQVLAEQAVALTLLEKVAEETGAKPTGHFYLSRSKQGSLNSS